MIRNCPSNPLFKKSVELSAKISRVAPTSLVNEVFNQQKGYDFPLSLFTQMVTSRRTKSEIQSSALQIVLIHIHFEMNLPIETFITTK